MYIYMYIYICVCVCVRVCGCVFICVYSISHSSCSKALRISSAKFRIRHDGLRVMSGLMMYPVASDPAG